jgi:hypothetical protein
MKKGSRLIGGIAALVFFMSTAHAATWYVHPDSTLCTIQGGLGLCSEDDTVLVGPGIYYENIVWPDTQGIDLVSEYGPDTTIVDGSASGCVIAISSGLDYRTTITGFTIQNGSYNNGAGIWCSGSDPVIRNNVIVGNSTTADGGGIFLIDGAAPTIEWNIIKNNRALTSAGGGIYVLFSSPYISRNLILGNKAASSGGGIAAAFSSPVILNNTIVMDTAGSGGGIFYFHNGTGTPDIRNNIVASNTGYGIYINSAADTLVISYNDIWANAISNYGGNGGVIEGPGSISADPLFVDPGMGNFYLQWGSPCIDAGDPMLPLDPDSTIADMGCYFFDQRMPNIELSATSLDFGSVTVGDSADLPLVIYNLGNGNLLLSDISNNLAVFTNNWNPLDSLILPGDSLAITVTFAPSDTITFVDTLWIDNNDTLCCATLTGLGLPTGIDDGLLTIPREFALRQPLPNPCKSLARIQFELPKASAVSLSIYDATGRLVAALVNEICEAGIHEAHWDASHISAGVYFYRLNAGRFSDVKKIVITK